MSAHPASLANLKPIRPGEVRNPSGAGSEQKRRTGKAAWKALLDDFEQHGAAAIVAMRESNPTAYVNLAASGLPAEKSIDLSVRREESLSEEQARMMAEEILERNKRRLALGTNGVDTVHDSVSAGLPAGDAAPENR